MGVQFQTKTLESTANAMVTICLRFEPTPKTYYQDYIIEITFEEFIKSSKIKPMSNSYKY